MWGRPAVAPGATWASTCSYVSGMPSAAIRATIRSSRVARDSRAWASSAISAGSSGSVR